MKSFMKVKVILIMVLISLLFGCGNNELDGTWLSNNHFRIEIKGDVIKIFSFDELALETKFKVDKYGYLKSTKLRENHELYDKLNRYEPFPYFESIKYEDGKLIGLMVIYDLGTKEVIFRK